MKTINAFLKTIGCLLAAATLTAACSETDAEEENIYANWTARNDSAFAQRLSEARNAVEQARKAYGADWQAHCNWRILTNLNKPGNAPFKSSDSIAVLVLDSVADHSSAHPYKADTVFVNYMGRTIGTKKYPAGYVFDHSGTSSDENVIFSPELCTPVKMCVDSNIKGFSTAVQQMHVGDKWRIFIHPDLAYGEKKLTAIPAHSMLDFTVELKAIYRAGTSAGSWK